MFEVIVHSIFIHNALDVGSVSQYGQRITFLAFEFTYIVKEYPLKFRYYYLLLLLLCICCILVYRTVMVLHTIRVINTENFIVHNVHIVNIFLI